MLCGTYRRGEGGKWVQMTIINELTKSKRCASSNSNLALHAESPIVSLFKYSLYEPANLSRALEINFFFFFSLRCPNSIMIINNSSMKKSSSMLNLGYSYTKIIIFRLFFFGCLKLENFQSSCSRFFLWCALILAFFPSLRYVLSKLFQQFAWFFSLNFQKHVKTFIISRRRLSFILVCYFLWFLRWWFLYSFLAGFVDWTHIKQFLRSVEERWMRNDLHKATKFLNLHIFCASKCFFLYWRDLCNCFTC